MAAKGHRFVIWTGRRIFGQSTRKVYLLLSLKSRAVALLRARNGVPFIGRARDRYGQVAPSFSRRQSFTYLIAQPQTNTYRQTMYLEGLRGKQRHTPHTLSQHVRILELSCI
jgi:hypothetical protein